MSPIIKEQSVFFFFLITTKCFFKWQCKMKFVFLTKLLLLLFLLKCIIFIKLSHAFEGNI